MRRIERRAPWPGGKTCAFAGHRPSKYPFLADKNTSAYASLKAALALRVDAAILDGYTHFLCGGALGADTLAAELMLEKRRSHPRLTLEIVVPCDDQDRLWREEDRLNYARLLDLADAVTRISPVYTPFCMRERNQYMIDLSDRLIAVYDGTKGGTFMSVLLALNKGIEVDIVKPLESQNETANV